MYDLKPPTSESPERGWQVPTGLWEASKQVATEIPKPELPPPYQLPNLKNISEVGSFDFI